MKDIKDLEMLLHITYIETPQSEIIHKDIVRICKQYKININIPGEE